MSIPTAGLCLRAPGVSFACLVAVGVGAFAQPFTITSTDLRPPTTSEGIRDGRFAWSIALADERVIVSGDSVGGSRFWSYSNEAGPWRLEQTITPPAGTTYPHLTGCGASFASKATREDDGEFTDTIHVFDRGSNGWIESAQLGPIPSREYSDNRLAADGEWIVVAVPQLDQVRVFRRGGGGWMEHSIIVPPAAIEFGYWGSHVSIHEDLLVVGSDGGVLASGAPAEGAFVYRFDGEQWVYEAQLPRHASVDPRAYYPDGVFTDGDRVTISARCPAGAESCESPGPNPVAVYARDASGDWVLEGELVAPDYVASYSFGASITMLGERMIVAYATISGPPEWVWGLHEYSFEAGSWQHVGTVASPQPMDSSFGRMLQSGSTLVVSAPYADTDAGPNAGMAYVYRLTGNEPPMLEASLQLAAGELSHGDQFGSAVDMSGEWCVAASAQDHGPPGARVGSVRVYRHDGLDWQLFQVLRASDDVALPENPMSVSVVGVRLLVLGSASAAVYRFEGAQWVLDGIIAIPGDWPGDTLNGVGDLGSDRVALGAQTATPGGSSVGVVHVFARNESGWVWRARLTAEEDVPVASFGQSIALDGTSLVVGASSWERSDGINTGTIYVYEENSGLPVRAARFGADGHTEFGYSLDIAGDRVVVGAPRWNINGGAIRVYRRTNTGWVSGATLLQPRLPRVDSIGWSVKVRGGVVATTVAYPQSATALRNGGVHYFALTPEGTWSFVLPLAFPLIDSFDPVGAVIGLDERRLIVGAPEYGTFTPQIMGAAFAYSFSGCPREDVLVQLDDGEPCGGRKVALLIDDSEIATIYSMTIDGEFAGSSIAGNGRRIRIVADLPSGAGESIDVGMSMHNPLSDCHAAAAATFVVAVDVRPVPGDFDADLRITTADIPFLLARFGTNDIQFDINGDGYVGLSDLATLLSRIGLNCNPS